MLHVEESIGAYFENWLQRRFEGLVKVRENPGKEPAVPDFYCSEFGFYVEAKAGNARWGPKLHDYQVVGFKSLDHAVIYALGFHGFDDAHARLRGRSEPTRQRHLERDGNISQVCFISGELIERIWEKERKMNEKGTIPYCQIKPAIINHLFLGREFRRSGQLVMPEEFYGFSYRDYHSFQHATQGLLWRGLIHKDHYNSASAFLRRNGVACE